jgi:hypothetical protein
MEVEFRILTRLVAFQNNQRLLGYRPTSELRSCALRSSLLRAQDEVASALRSATPEYPL